MITDNIKSKAKKVLGALLLTTTLNSKEILIILDSSASMQGSQTYMRKAIRKNINKPNVTIVGFGSNWYNIKQPSDYQIGGSTSLSPLLSTLNNGNNPRFDYIIIATDGEPANPILAKKEIELIKRRGTKICSVYLSSIPSDTIPRFLSTVSDKVFLSTVADPISKCQGEVEKELMGYEAVKKRFDSNKFAF